MSELGKYGFLLHKALEQMGPGPWKVSDLDQAKEVLTEKFCLAFDAECDKDAVVDWLAALPESEKTDLIGSLNIERQAGARDAAD